MVLKYYNLRDQPFGVTPDPRYLYLSASHREALASLSYGIGSRRGFMSLIAKPGMGKTTILFELLSQLQGSAKTVFLFQTLCSPKDLMRSLLSDLGVVDAAQDTGRMQEQLNRVLLAEARQGRRVVVVIDEAQNLEDAALELLRMLSNFETTSYKLMQIILAGQPQLREKLASPHLLQLRQRMSIFARLHPFSIEETRLYISHRLRVAGYDFKTPLFTPKAAALIAQYSEGIPRNINNICFSALSLGCVLKQKSIREEVVRECLNNLDFETEETNRDEEFAERKQVTSSAPQATTVSRSPFAWLRRLAVCIMLFLLCSGSGRQRLEAHSVPLVIASSQMGPMQLGSAMPTGHPRSTAPVTNSEVEPTTKLSPAPLTEEPHRKPENLSSPSAQKSAQQSRAHFKQARDPDTLWAEVKNQNSDAEIELARLYLEGTAVPQNCAQAQVLLQAASRRGNARAVDLLKDSGGQCR